MGGLKKKHDSTSLPRRKPDLLPFRNANPEKLENLTSTSGLSPDVPALNYAVNSCTLPFAATSVSPLRAKTMKEYDQQITDLKKENFNLKLRIYFLEEKMQQKFGASDEHLQMYKANLELKVEMESLKRNLKAKIDLLSQASDALETLEKQHRVNIRELQETSSKQKKELEEQIRDLSARLETFRNNSIENINASLTDNCDLQGKESIISELTEELKLLKDRSCKSDKTIQGLFETVRCKEKEIHTLTKRLKGSKDFNCSNEESLLRNITQKSNQESDCCDSKSRIMELRTVLDKFQEETKKSAEAHAKICADKDAMIDQLQTSLQNLQNTLEQKLNENTEKEEIENFQKVILGLRHEIQDRDMQLEELKCETKLAEDQNFERINKFEDQVSKLQKDLANEEKGNSCLKEKFLEKENDLKSARTLVAAKEQEIILLNQKNFDLSSVQHNVDASYEKNVEDLKKNLLSAKEKLDLVETKFVKSKNENDLYNSLLREKEKEVNNAESRRLALMYKVSSLEETINELTAENQELICEMKDFKLEKCVESEEQEITKDKEYNDEKESDKCNHDSSKLDQNQVYQEEIKHLKNKLTQSFMCCDMLKCRLEEIANFLDRLLNYEKYNGQLTPQQVASLHCFLVESRDLSQSLSMTLNGDNPSFLGTHLSFEDSAFMSSPYTRSDKVGRESLFLPKLPEEPESAEKFRRAEFSVPEDLLSSNSLPLKQQDHSTIWNHSSVTSRSNQLFHHFESQKDNSNNCEVIHSKHVHPDSASDSDVWSEPDRNISLQRIGLDSSILQPEMYSENNSTTTGDNKNQGQNLSSFFNISQGLQKSKVNVTIIKRLYSKLKNLQQLNNSLKAEIHVYHNLEDKKNSETSNQLSSGFMAEHITVVQALHDKLEKSIGTNECLQKTLTKIAHDGMNNVYNSNLIEEIAKYEAKLVKQEGDYKQVCSANADLQEKLIKKCQEIDVEKSTLSEVREQLDDTEKALAILKTSNDELKTEGENLKIELNGFEHVNGLVSKLKDDIFAKESKISELSLVFDDKIKELKEIQDWNLRLQSEINEKQNQFKKLESDIKVLIDGGCKKDETIKDLKDSYLDLQGILKMKDEKLEYLQNTNKELLIKLDGLSKNDQDQVSRLKDLETKFVSTLKTKEEEIEHLRSANEEFLTKLETFRIKNQEQILRIEDTEAKLASMNKCMEKTSETREVSTETSASFTHVAFPEGTRNFYDESPNNDSTVKNELQSRVSSFLDNKRLSCESSIKERLSGSRLQAEDAGNNYNSRIYDESNLTENRHNSTHYSSPDLGIESDPNNRDCKDSMYSTVEEEPRDTNTKYHHHSKLSDITNLHKLNVIELKSRGGSLFVMCPLVQHELLKKEVVESLVILSGMQSRVKDVVKSFAKAKTTPMSSKSFEQDAMKVLDKNCKNISLCLQRSSEVLNSFSIFDMSTLQESLLESNAELSTKNSLLQEEMYALSRISDKHKRDMEDAIHKLSIIEKKKKGMEKAITKQLQKTNLVLRQAKTNLQTPDV